MSQRAVVVLLCVYGLVAASAVVLRIDRFPLSWAPMYAVWKPKASKTYRVTHVDREWLKEYGWRATHCDGRESWVGQRDLNVRTSSMARMYYRRTRGKGAPKYSHMNHDAGTLDRWLWGLAPGEAYYDIDWRRRLLVSVNKTLGHTPGAPEFIVELHATGKRSVFDRASVTWKRTTQWEARATWDEHWNNFF